MPDWVHCTHCVLQCRYSVLHNQVTADSAFVFNYWFLILIFLRLCDFRIKRIKRSDFRSNDICGALWQCDVPRWRFPQSSCIISFPPKFFGLSRSTDWENTFLRKVSLSLSSFFTNFTVLESHLWFTICVNLLGRAVLLKGPANPRIAN